MRHKSLAYFREPGLLRDIHVIRCSSAYDKGGGGGDDAPYYCSSYTLLLPLNSFSFQGILVVTISEVHISCWERSPPRILLFPSYKGHLRSKFSRCI